MPIKTGLQRYLGQCAKAVLERERPFIIGVTGSVGKSTAKQMIGAALQAHAPEHRVRVPAGSFNNELGLPLTVFGASYPRRSPMAWLSLLMKATAGRFGLWKTGINTFVFEMGADKPGDIEYLTSIAKPDVAVITAVTPEDPELPPVHSAFYPSIDALAEQKSQLVKAVRDGGSVVLNADDKRVFAMRHLTHEHVTTFGEMEQAEVRILETQIVMEDRGEINIPTGIRTVITVFGHRYEFYFDGVFGRPIAYAAAAAVGVVAEMDIEQEQVRSMPQYYIPMPGRTRIIPGIKHTTLLDDTYNSSPAAAISALRDLGRMPLKAGQRRVACLGEMRELGDESANLHRRVGAEAARSGLDLLVCCGTFSAAMAEGALANGMKPEQVQVIEDTPEAGLFIQNWLQAGDVVLAKASQGTIHTKGVRMERVIKELMAEPLRASELLVRQDEAWKRT